MTNKNKYGNIKRFAANDMLKAGGMHYQIIHPKLSIQNLKRKPRGRGRKPKGRRSRRWGSHCEARRRTEKGRTEG